MYAFVVLDRGTRERLIKDHLTKLKLCHHDVQDKLCQYMASLCIFTEHILMERCENAVKKCHIVAK